MSETNRGQLGVLQEMSSWCLQDLETKMNRTKIETLVTIQVRHCLLRPCGEYVLLQMVVEKCRYIVNMYLLCDFRGLSTGIG